MIEYKGYGDDLLELTISCGGSTFCLPGKFEKIYVFDNINEFDDYRFEHDAYYQDFQDILNGEFKDVEALEINYGFKFELTGSYIICSYNNDLYIIK